MKTQISFNQNFLYATAENSVGIRKETQTQTAERVQHAIAAVEKKLADHQYGFVEVLAEDHYLTAVEVAFENIRWAKTLVVIGIGGSDLGARAVQQALEVEKPPFRVIFHGDSTDPVAITRLLRSINLDETVFNIISKSGETVETISQYIYLKQVVQQSTGEWQKHFLFTTDEKNGILREEADREKVATLPIPPTVGGRFSVLTPVGLLPAVAMGVDIRTLVRGAVEFAASTEMRVLAQNFATSQFQLYTQGMKLVVMAPYSVQLEEFARWFRQLWAESLGKDGKGILPIQARGPADQHSQYQFYNQGTSMQSLFFIRIEHAAEDYTLSGIGVPAVQYLEGHSFHEILNTEQEASALALKKVGRPSAVLSMSKLDADSLGKLFMFFELAVVYVAEMLGVNAFDQPGVEEGKQMMYALMGRAGFEAKRAEIEELKKA